MGFFLCLVLFLVRLTGLLLSLLRFLFCHVLLALNPALLFFQPLLLLLLLLDDEVVALQMFKPGLRLLPASFHVQCLSHHILHHGHIIGIELEGFPGLPVHPVPDYVCVVVRLPGLFICRVFIVAFVFVKEDLDGLDAPRGFHHPGVFKNVVKSGVFLDVHDALTDGTASLSGVFLPVLVGVLDIVLLHGASGLFLDHDTDGCAVLFQGDAFHSGCDIRTVVLRQVETDVEFPGIERLDVLFVPPVVSFALGDIAWLHMIGSLGCSTH